MYSVIDIESNGAGYRQESIIDIAIFKYDGHEIVDQFMSLVNPDAPITNYVQKLTRITPNMVKTAPKFHEIAKRIVEITNGTTLVGHNIDFDYRMLRQSFKRLGYDFKINTLDTIPLAQKLIPNAESYSLGKLVRSLGIPIADQHRAGGDARATLELFKLLISKDAENEIISSQFEENNTKNYVNKVRKLTQDLPSESGIVYFQNEKGEIIFCDYCKDISRFSKNILNSVTHKFEKIRQETAQIHYETTGNEIAAKLILPTKGIAKKIVLPYGLYFRNGKYFAEKINTKMEEALLRFQSITQAKKAMRYINSLAEFADLKEFNHKINISAEPQLWSGEGRKLGEKLFLILKNSEVHSFGFYDYFTQIATADKIDKLKIDVKGLDSNFKYLLKLALLQNEFKILPLPESA